MNPPKMPNTVTESWKDKASNKTQSNVSDEASVRDGEFI